MKKTVVFIMIFCLLTTAICITAFANESRSSAVISISALNRDGSTVVIDNKDNFADGWNEAVKLAKDINEMNSKGYYRIIVDLYTDWNAEDGSFGSGEGFSLNAICFPENTNITLNLNGCTVNRGLERWEWNGEVIRIEENADVIINNGTVTGGWSKDSAGGIHVENDARVALNEVDVVGNISDGDGGGIAVHNGASLAMNGGSLSNNDIMGDSLDGASIRLGGAIYVEDSEADLKDVDIKNNRTLFQHHLGVAAYAKNSKLTLDSCRVEENGTADEENGVCAAYTVIDGYRSQITVKNTDFINNGAYLKEEQKIIGREMLYSALISLDYSHLTMEDGNITNNNTAYLLAPMSESKVIVSNVSFTDNTSDVMYGSVAMGSLFKECTFNNNAGLYSKQDGVATFGALDNVVSFYDCDMGDSTFENEDHINVADTEAAEGIASMFGGGSLIVVVSLVAVISSIASIWVNVSSYKNYKKANAVKNADSDAASGDNEE